MSNDSKNKSSSAQYQINPDTYQWTSHAMKTLLKVSNLTIQTHGNKTAWQEGNIFLFNHFARFETFIPQYLIYEKTGLYSRSIGSKELFADNILGRYLSDLGGIPNNADSLMYHVSKDILQQQKLIAFPEGGIVKDRKILDEKGRYSIYSRSQNERRKLHTGPAVIALAIAIFKQAVRQIHDSNGKNILSQWSEELGFKSTQEFLKICQKPTLIIPCNITFYPLRVSDNALKDSILFFVDDLHQRLSEELLIEGNLLLKDTDMDIFLGAPIVVENYWSRIESAITSAFVKNADLSLKEIFNRVQNDNEWKSYLFRLSYQRNTDKIRDAYMHDIYRTVTINIAHIASTLIMHFVHQGKPHVNKKKLHHLIYCTVKNLQKDTSLNYHQTITNPSIYRNLLMTKSETFDQFLQSVYKAKLLESNGPYYIFTEQLTCETDFDSIRYKNPLAVYANEVASLPEIKAAIKTSLAFKFNKKLNQFADMRFEDELLEYHWDLAQFQEQKHQEVNQQQNISEQSALPYLLKPKQHNGECVVLVHGLLSSPAELRTLGEKLYRLGYIVIGCRLKGHGTTPWDLHTRTWQDWEQSVRQSIKIALCYTKSIHLVGFSSGSLLALLVACNKNLHISSVTACSIPIILKDPLIALVKGTDFANKLIKQVSRSEGIMPLKKNRPEHPHINYQHTPIAAINQLLFLIKRTMKRVRKLSCPTLLIQADNDPVVSSVGITELSNVIPKKLLQHHWVSSNRHGILYENTENCQQKVIDFICQQSK